MDAVSDLLAPPERTPARGMSQLVAALRAHSGAEAMSAAAVPLLAAWLGAVRVEIHWPGQSLPPAAPGECAASAPIPGDPAPGLLIAYWPAPHAPSRAEQETLEAAASVLALAAESDSWRRQARHEHARLNAVFEHVPSLIAFKDLDGRYIAASRRCSALFSGRDPRGRTLEEIVPDPEAAARIRAHDEAALAAGHAIEFEETVPGANGLRTYQSTRFPVTGLDGEPLGVANIATDVTEQRSLEAAGRWLGAIVEDSDEAIISKDLEGFITSWNRGAEQLFGYTAAEAVGQPIALLRLPENNDEMPRILDRIRRGERIEHYETRRRRKDGVIIDVALTISPIRDRNGVVAGASKIARDITSRKRDERERVLLLAREKEARQTAELIQRVALRVTGQLELERLLGEVTTIATSLVRADYGAFYRADAAPEEACTIAGLTSAEFAGSVFARIVHGAARAQSHENVFRCDNVDAGPQSGPGITRSYLEAAVSTARGDILGWMCFGHPEPGRFTEANAAFIHGLSAQAGVALDNARLFEEARRRGAELKRANDELQRANRDLEVFAYSASHDLQEPLRTVAISAQILERNLAGQLADADAAFLRNILAAARRMSGLTRDLLEYTRLAAPDDAPPEPADANAVLAAVCENLAAAIRESGAEIIASPLPRVAVPAARLARVLQNLIGNAIKYRGNDPPRIEVTVQQQDGCWMFSVTDNGIGIEPQYAKQIFGLFKRLHGRDRYDGSGIGLALCQRVVEQYGGQIWLERSSPGHGSTFRFSLPLAE